jgi:hypothetical protein
LWAQDHQTWELRWPSTARCLRALGLVLAVLIAGCAGEITSPPTMARDDGAALHVWPADAELRVLALGAADRILFATGLVVVVDETPTAGATPLFWSDVPGDLLGFCVGVGAADMLLVSPTAPRRALDNIVLHEVLHALGAQHVAEPGQIMSEGLGPDGAEQLTAGDLEAVCSVRDCDVFAPEVAAP